MNDGNYACQHCETEEHLKSTQDNSNEHNCKHCEDSDLRHGDSDENHGGVVCCCGKEHGKADKKSSVAEIAALIASLIFLIIGYFDWKEIGFSAFYYVNPAWVAVVLCGTPIFFAAAKSVAHAKISTPVLIAIAMTAAIALEIVGFFYNIESDGHGHGHSYVFAAGEIAFLMALGGFIEDATLVYTRKRIGQLGIRDGKSVAIATENAEKRASISKAADKLATVIVPIVLVLAVAVGLVSGAVFKLNAVDALIRGVAVLVAFCPCSLALAAPIAIAAGTGRSAMDGVFVKNDESLENLSKVSTVCADKSVFNTDDGISEKFGKCGCETVLLSNSPQENAKTIADYREKGENVLYVGENSETAKAADCWVDFGNSSHFADIIVQNPSPEVIESALKISKRTILTVKCNIILAMTINFAAVAASFFGFLSPAAGALVHNCTSVFVVLSSVLLLYKRKRRIRR